MIVASGRCLAGLAEDPVELGPGDYIVYPGDLPHICKALEPGTTAMMVMEHTV
jgi:quercetin dioxygenase-like cupin family protein